MRTIAVVNESTLVGEEEIGRCLEALQTQVSRDFADTWGIDARLRSAADPEDEEEILYLFDDHNQAHSAGGFDPQAWWRPCGYVFVRTCLDRGGAWQTRVSHELLEMLADPLIHLAAEGPVPGSCQGPGQRPAQDAALFALEVCDPVGGEDYEINGVPAANFVLPTWFSTGRLPDEALVDFLGRLAEPFTLTPCGYATWCTQIGRWQTWFAKRCPKPHRDISRYSRRRRRMQPAAADCARHQSQTEAQAPPWACTNAT